MVSENAQKELQEKCNKLQAEIESAKSDLDQLTTEKEALKKQLDEAISKTGDSSICWPRNTPKMNNFKRQSKLTNSLSSLSPTKKRS